MNFVTQTFILFFLIALPCCLLCGRSRNYFIPVLLLFNIIFYSHSGMTGLLVLLSVAFVTWSGAALLSIYKNRTVLALGIGAVVSILAIFKYYDFLLLSASNSLTFLGIDINLDSLLEYNDIFVYITGLSFFSFQAIAYLADLYQGRLSRRRSFTEILAYLSFFPTVCAGPIMRPEDFFDQTYTHHADEYAFCEGIAYILSGLIKKVIIASYLSEHLVRDVFTNPDAFSSAAVLFGVYGYSVQIFCDFSGYTDLAIGIGRLMGFKLPQNFDSPYLSLNIQDFWRRWHITLSFWLRDYVYIPLGGSRHGNTYVNLMATMLIGGLWHGSSWTFVLWGGILGLGLAVHRMWSRHIRLRFESAAGKFLCWFATFHFITLLWILFRAENFALAKSVFLRLFRCDLGGEGFPLLTIAAIASCFVIHLYGKRAFALFVSCYSRLHWIIQAALAGAAGTLIMMLGPEGTLPFIYFGF